LVADNPWLVGARLVVKPDQLFSKRGKHGLLGVDLSFEEVQAWIVEYAYKEVTVGQTTDKLTTFIIEPFIPHAQEDEMFIAIRTQREGDVIYFSWEGGIDIEENWDSVVQIFVPIELTANMFAGADATGAKSGLLKDLDIGGQILAARKHPSSPPTEGIEGGKATVTNLLIHFIEILYKFFVDLGFAYLEVNPFVLGSSCRDAKSCVSTDPSDVVPLDFVAHLDDTAVIMDAWRRWNLGPVDFPPPFGRRLTSEEAYIRNLDEKSGCSLKLTVLNPKGRVWPMVAGGGASVIYADTVTDLGFADELACYGEYSGNPTTDETREYARTILDLMTREPDPEGRPKFLLIGGGIANFTDVAKTFTGIMDALREYRDKLRANNVRIYVRRGGPNHEVGLAMMRQLGEELAVPLEVYGPETHMTRIVRMALG
jgi:ATP-citrate lyase beta-subunit